MVLTRVVHLLSIFALLFGVISMTGGHAAMAMPMSGENMHHAQAAPMSAHCAEMAQSQKQDQQGPARADIDCMIACSLILGAVSGSIEPQLLIAPTQTPSATDIFSGFIPEYDPPPPRIL